MKTVFEHIEHVKGKPHHVRKRIAFAAAAIGAGITALVWLIGSISFGTFALQGNSFADSAGQSPTVTTGGSNDTSNLAGAAAGISAALQNTNTSARIEIVDTTASASGRKAEQTTLPF